MRTSQTRLLGFASRRLVLYAHLQTALCADRADSFARLRFAPPSALCAPPNGAMRRSGRLRFPSTSSGLWLTGSASHLPSVLFAPRQLASLQAPLGFSWNFGWLGRASPVSSHHGSASPRLVPCAHLAGTLAADLLSASVHLDSRRQSSNSPSSAQGERRGRAELRLLSLGPATVVRPGPCCASDAAAINAGLRSPLLLRH